MAIAAMKNGTSILNDCSEKKNDRLNRIDGRSEWTVGWLGDVDAEAAIYSL